MEGEFWRLSEVPREAWESWWEQLLSNTHLPWSVRVAKQWRDRDYEAWVRRQWVDDLALVDCEYGPCLGSRRRSQLSWMEGEYITVLIIRSGSETVTQEDTEANLRPGDAIAWDSPT